MKRRERVTLISLASAAAVDAADARILPALFRSLEKTFGFGPERLSTLMVGQSLALALSSPIWGHLADRYSRVRLLAFGCFSWALWTLLMATAGSFVALLATRILAGMALAAVAPIAQSLVADLAAPASRGCAFGVILAVGNVGAWMGGMLGTALGSQTLGGLEGWRVVLVLVAAISWILGIVVLWGAHEPSRLAGHREEPLQTLLPRLLQLRTFQLIVLQGVFGAVPWNALSFATMWLQYCGHSDLTASSIASWHVAGGAAGGLLGGVLGDVAARWSPSRGRIRVAQCSTLGGVPIVYSLLTNGSGTSAAPLGAVGDPLHLSLGFFALGLVSSWCSSGVNRPILSEIVPEGARGSVMAWSIAFEVSPSCCPAARPDVMLTHRTSTHPSRPIPALGRALLPHSLVRLW